MAASPSAPSTRALPWRRLRSYALEIRTECLRMLREPMFVLPVLLFPALFYVLFGVLLNRGNASAAQYLLASYGVFGVIGAAMFGLGVGIAVDRQRGLLRLKRVLPVPAGAPLLAKMVMAMAFAMGVSILVGLLARFLAGVQLAPSQWGLLLVVDVLGALPFCAIGLYFGTLVSGSAAPALLNLVYLPMAFLSGLWLPLSMLPDVLGRIAPVWPAYHLAQLALKAVGHDQGTPAWQHVLML
ncbi:MAG TPA: ABC transporter permease, partial [Xanthomonadaceae bacterium]|nr:ABC transporter permease [Xanthomonadaceae bacterium]